MEENYFSPATEIPKHMLVCLMGTDFESIYGMYRGILSENIHKEGIPAAVIPFILTDISNLRFSQAQNTHDLLSHAVPKKAVDLCSWASHCEETSLYHRRPKINQQQCWELWDSQIRKVINLYCPLSVAILCTEDLYPCKASQRTRLKRTITQHVWFLLFSLTSIFLALKVIQKQMLNHASTWLLP